MLLVDTSCIYVCVCGIRFVYVCISIYTNAFMQASVINIQKMALSTSHEGNFLCVYHPSAMQIASLCD